MKRAQTYSGYPVLACNGLRVRTRTHISPRVLIRNAPDNLREAVFIVCFKMSAILGVQRAHMDGLDGCVMLVDGRTCHAVSAKTVTLIATSKPLAQVIPACL